MQPRARRQAEAAEAPKANDGDDNETMYGKICQMMGYMWIEAKLYRLLRLEPDSVHRGMYFQLFS